jgi:inorganic pyrophosphatase
MLLVLRGFALVILLCLPASLCAQIIELKIADLKPTQAVISHQQVALKIQQYRDQPQRFIKELKDTPEKTVVRGPNGYYLTDGHHTLSAVRAFHPDAEQAIVRLTLVADQSALSMEDFWRWMLNQGQTWLFDARGEPLLPAHLPAQVGIEFLPDDPLRGAMYLLRDRVWQKPKPALPFVEFYWAQWLRHQPDYQAYTDNTQREFAQWLAWLAQKLQNLDLATTIGPASATAMGLLPAHPQRRPVLPSLSKFQSPQLATAIIEIPAGSRAKWQVQKGSKDRFIEWERQNGQLRVIDFLPYPANYGSIPGTLADKQQGGDGDPLDVWVLGDALPMGATVQVRLIGMIRMLDDGEIDDKYLAVLPEDPGFGTITDLVSLGQHYPAVLAILETWLSNYKGVHSAAEIIEIVGPENF